MKISLKICQFGQIVVLLAAFVSIANSMLVYRVGKAHLSEGVEVTKIVTDFTERFKDGRVKIGTTTTEKNNTKTKIPVDLATKLLIVSTFTNALITLGKALVAYALLTIAIAQIRSLNGIPVGSPNKNQGRSNKSNVRPGVYDEHLPDDA